jgi:hypothetical protein
MVRETVAMETFARLAMVRMSMRSGAVVLFLPLFFFSCPVSAIGMFENAFTE